MNEQQKEEVVSNKKKEDDDGGERKWRKTAHRVSHQILIKEYDNFMENFWPCAVRTMHPSLQTS